MKKQCLSIRLLWAVIYHFQSINKIWINISLNVLLKSISQLTLLRNLYNESIFLYVLNDLCALCWVLHVQGSWSSFNKVNHFIVSFRHFSFHLLSKFLNPEFICECVLWQYQHFFFLITRDKSLLELTTYGVMSVRSSSQFLLDSTIQIWRQNCNILWPSFLQTEACSKKTQFMNFVNIYTVYKC